MSTCNRFASPRKIFGVISDIDQNPLTGCEVSETLKMMNKMCMTDVPSNTDDHVLETPRTGQPKK